MLTKETWNNYLIELYYSRPYTVLPKWDELDEDFKISLRYLYPEHLEEINILLTEKRR